MRQNLLHDGYNAIVQTPAVWQTALARHEIRGAQVPVKMKNPQLRIHAGRPEAMAARTAADNSSREA